MIEELPKYISYTFGLTTLLTFLFLFFVLAYSDDEKTNSLVNPIVIILTLWLFLQLGLSIRNFYTINTTAVPPRFVLLVLPPLITILILFITRKGRRFIDSLPLTQMTYLHVIRIPVEIVLYWLFIHKKIPQLMTFAGRNFDILAGITAPFIAYFGVQKNYLGRGVLIAWNFICLGLLINIVVNAVLSAPFAFQQFAFDQPDIAVLYFPFTWLPCFVVPVVLFCHLASLRKLLYNTLEPAV